jgi:tetratricopeptide (TPR) repeat protein
MPFSPRFGVLFLLGALLWSVAPARAANEGQDDLDHATQAKLNARTRTDLGEVIRLAESALKKGLDEGNTQFAKELLASTCIQRGTSSAGEILRLPPDPNWREIRRVALEDLEKGLAIDANQPQALLLVAQLNLLPGGDAKRAHKALDEAVNRSADQPQVRAKALMARAGFADDAEHKLKDLDQAVKVNSQDVAPLRARGNFYLDQKKYDKALADFEAAAKLDPESAAAWESAGVTLIDLKRYDDALAALKKAHELEPKEPTPLLQMARAHGLKTDYKAALDDLNEASQLDPANLAMFLLRASVFEEMKEREKALADVDRVLKLAPGLTEAMRLRAVILAGSGKFAEATTQLEQLHRETPADEDVALQLALFYNAAKRPHKAVQMFDKMLAEKPGNANALQGRADALLSMGKQAEAIADYEKVLAQDPKNAEVLNNLAWVLATSPDEKLRNGKRALELATRSAESTSYNQAHILSTLASAYAELGDFDNARKWSQKSVEIGKESIKEELQKELKSYQDNKPWREFQQIKDDDTELPGLPGEKPKEKPKEPPVEKPKESSKL